MPFTPPLMCALLLAALLPPALAAGPAASVASMPPSALSPQALKNATYRGLEGVGPAVTLVDGRYEGRPYAPGGASRPQAVMAAQPTARGDLDGDGVDEAVVLIETSGGGSGTFTHVAVVGARQGQPRNLDTRLVGDRVQVRGLRVEGGRVLLDLVRGGPQDPACCPGELATLAWKFGRGRLQPVASGVPTARLSPAVTAGAPWVLRHWGGGEGKPAPTTPEITLSLEGERWVGESGCNRYFAGVTAGETAGDVKVAAPGATRRACEAEAMALEQRYLALLARVGRLGFRHGELVLDYIDGQDAGSLRFGRR